MTIKYMVIIGLTMNFGHLKKIQITFFIIENYFESNICSLLQRQNSRYRWNKTLLFTLKTNFIF